MVGENLKRIREEKGFGLNELSRMSKVNASYISAIENGVKKNPSITTLQKLAGALDVNADELLSTEEKLDIAYDVIERVNSMAKGALSVTSENLNNSIYSIMSRFSNENFSEKEQDEIIKFIEFMISKRK